MRKMTITANMRLICGQTDELMMCFDDSAIEVKQINEHVNAARSERVKRITYR